MPIPGRSTELVARRGNASARIRIVLVDDQLMFLESLAARIDCDARMEVVGIATNAVEGRRLIFAERPDIVILEVVLPDQGAFDLAAEAARQASIRVLFLTGYLSDIFLVEALRAHASGYLLKDEPADVLIESIFRAHAGEQCFSQAVRGRLQYDDVQRHFSMRVETGLNALSSRQVEILQHLAKGRSVKEVARSLHLSEKSVDSHKYRIMHALNIHDRVELARYAIREGLTVP